MAMQTWREHQEAKCEESVLGRWTLIVASVVWWFFMLKGWF
jgi:hypothetical protein